MTSLTVPPTPLGSKAYAEVNWASVRKRETRAGPRIMSTVGNLSSYFSKRRKDQSGGRKNTEEVSGKHITSVRARLERKLHHQQKTGFAFNFAVDSDEIDPQQQEVAQKASAEEKGFLFGFNPTNTDEVGSGKPAESPGVDKVSGANLGAAQDFSVEIERRRVQPQGKSKAKKKRAGKKKKGGKGKGKATEQKPRQELAAEPSETAATSTVNEGGGETGECFPLPIEAASHSSPNPCRVNTTPEVTEPGDVREQRHRAPLRPPPGFTLESWKDPTLSAEERRRRRFGSGVRNMIAIQRRCDARRELAVDGDLDDELRSHREGAQQIDAVRAGAPVAASSGGVGGGSSVFAFGFDIGISFDGGI